MNDYKMLNGRRIHLKRLSLVGTYSGFLEGSKLEASGNLLKFLPQRAAELLAPGHPIAVIWPPQDELPPWLCVAQFESYSSVYHDDPDYNSRLYVCWFMEDTSRSLDDIIVSILPDIPWETMAEDYDMMGF